MGQKHGFILLGNFLLQSFKFYMMNWSQKAEAREEAVVCSQKYILLDQNVCHDTFLVSFFFTFLGHISKSSSLA